MAANMVTIGFDGNLSRYLQAVNRFPMLTPEEDCTLASGGATTPDLAAAHKLVTSHLRLVAKIAMGYAAMACRSGT